MTTKWCDDLRSVQDAKIQTRLKVTFYTPLPPCGMNVLFEHFFNNWSNYSLLKTNIDIN
jgi:hypothetical protein